MDITIHVSITQISNGYRISAKYKDFCKKYGEWGIEVSPRKLGETMYEVADWIENDLKLGCLFYVE